MIIAFALRVYVMNQSLKFVYNYRGYRIIGIVLTILHFCIVFFTNSYSGILRRGNLVEFMKVFVHGVIMSAGLISFIYLMGASKQASRLVIVGYIVLSIMSIYIVRITMKHFIKSKKLGSINLRHILLISNRGDIEKDVDNFNNNSNDCELVGIVILDSSNAGTSDDSGEKSKKSKPGEISGVPVVAYTSEDAYEFAVRNIVDEVMYINLNSNSDINREIANTFLQMGVTVHLNLSMLSTGMPNVVVEKMNGYTVMTSSINVITPAAAFIKRATDIVAGIVGCIITGLLFIVLAPAIKIADPGPAFFSQKRVGKNGRIFTIYKFRSMYKDAEARKKDLMKNNKMEGLMFKMDADPRIIGSGPDGKRKGVGYWIRTLSLDEFPNFLSILKGDMSLVGTRPPTVDEFEKYSLHHKSRLAAKPGLTGLWQVSGRSDKTDFEEIVALDAEYIKNWSLALDFKIVVKTFFVVFGRKGSM